MSEDSQAKDIGKLEGKIDFIIRQQDEAAQDRRHVISKLEEIGNRSFQSDMKIDNLSKRVEAMEPHVEEFNKWQQRWIGAVMLVSFASASAGAALVAGGKKVWAAIAG